MIEKDSSKRKRRLHDHITHETEGRINGEKKRAHKRGFPEKIDSYEGQRQIIHRGKVSGRSRAGGEKKWKDPSNIDTDKKTSPSTTPYAASARVRVNSKKGLGRTRTAERTGLGCTGTSQLRKRPGKTQTGAANADRSCY